MTQKQDNQNNSDWTGEAEMWAYNQGLDIEIVHDLLYKANSKAEFYEHCKEWLKSYRPIDYTEEIMEVICSIFDC
jgi:hypothetical protein